MTLSTVSPPLHQDTTPTSEAYADRPLDIVFHVIILIIDAFLERRDRQMFELREQLKMQFMATQRAQQAEKQAADLKKRFASYSESSSHVAAYSVWANAL